MNPGVDVAGVELQYVTTSVVSITLNATRWPIVHTTSLHFLTTILMTLAVQVVSLVQRGGVFLLGLWSLDLSCCQVGKDLCRLLWCGLVLLLCVLLVCHLITPLYVFWTLVLCTKTMPSYLDTGAGKGRLPNAGIVKIHTLIPPSNWSGVPFK